jgi:hypothetical protein
MPTVRSEGLVLASALLYVGTTTVISSVTRVDDAAALATMTAYHRLLAAGASPAEALAQAALTEQFSPFVCFGDGQNPAARVRHTTYGPARSGPGPY